jgi:hypothetical protein
LESRDLPSNFTLDPLVQISGPSPFNGTLNQPALYRDAETENFVAVDPASPNHAVVAWFQDLAAGIVTAVTFDGGATWKETVVPGLTLCSGGTYPSAADPWVAFAPNGDVYVSSIENHFFEHNHGNAIHVNKSTDGGETWGAPGTLVEDLSAGFNFDKPSTTADPQDANYAYAVWNRSDQGNRFTRSQTLFTRTTDGGVTWEPGRVIYTPGNDDGTIGDQIVVQPDGTLLDFFTEQLQKGNNISFQLCIMRSTDHGLTWSAPLRAAQMLGNVVSDPETGQPVTTAASPPPLFDVAQDPTSGNLYAVWEDARFSNAQHNGIAFSMSTDGGLTWSVPVPINKTPTDIAGGNQNAFLPSVEVAGDGTVGVTYFDFRNNTTAAGLLTDYWFIHANPGTSLTDPANWGQELRLTDTSFDLEKAPLGPAGLFVGDYEGLAAAGNDFVPTWAMPLTNPDKTTDLASIFSRRINADPPVLAAPSVAAEGFRLSPAPAASPLAVLPGGPGSDADPGPLQGRDVRTADRGRAGAGVIVPHREHATGTLTDVVPGTLYFAGTGTAAHFGRYTITGSNCFDDQGNVLNGTFTTTAADGSTISGIYSGTYTVLSDGTVRFDVQVQWLEGTGRLARVTRDADVVAYLDGVYPGAGFEYFTVGTLTLPVAGRGRPKRC